MNTTTFNDGITKSHLQTLGIDLGVVYAPLFLSHDSEMEARWGGGWKHFWQGVSSGILLPYPLMRFGIDYDHKDSVFKCIRYWIEQTSDFVRIFSECVFASTGECLLTLFRYRVGDGAPSAGKHLHHQYLWLGGEWVSVTECINDIKEIAEYILDGVAEYLGYFMAYSSHVAKVCPDKIGKSVEWRAARTHFVLLHKSHPANEDGLKAGVRVVEDEAYRVRAAHSRRAHWRLLGSSKFKHKQGLRIRVKSTWVGPLEWKQGTSIYKIVESC